MNATIVEDALQGYDLTITYDSTIRQYVASARDEHGIALTATYSRRGWEMRVAERPIPVRALVARINDWLFRYTKTTLLMPEDYPMMPVLA